MLKTPFSAGCLATIAVLATVVLAASACSSGSDSPTTPTGKTTGTPGSTAKLQKESGKGAIKNVFAKTQAGTKISLYAAAPGHEIMEQTYNADVKTWSTPTSVFKDATRYCHSLKLKASGPVMAATVACSLSAQDTTGSQKSYVLVSTDGKTWKRADLTGATGKPSISPNGKYVSWTSPTSFLLWNSTGSFTTAKYAQSSDSPTVAVSQDDGTVLLIKATENKDKSCTISFASLSAKATTAKPINSTLPQPYPKCVATTAKMQGTDVIANINTTSTTKESNGKKTTKTTTHAFDFHKLSDGKWIIKSS